MKDLVEAHRMDAILRHQLELSDLSPKERSKLVTRNYPKVDMLMFIRYQVLPSLQEQVLLIKKIFQKITSKFLKLISKVEFLISYELRRNNLFRKLEFLICT